MSRPEQPIQGELLTTERRWESTDPNSAKSSLRLMPNPHFEEPAAAVDLRGAEEVRYRDSDQLIADVIADLREARQFLPFSRMVNDFPDQPTAQKEKVRSHLEKKGQQPDHISRPYQANEADRLIERSIRSRQSAENTWAEYGQPLSRVVGQFAASMVGVSENANAPTIMDFEQHYFPADSHEGRKRRRAARRSAEPAKNPNQF